MLPSLHASGAPATQVPPAQVSPVVQAFPSLQGAVLLVNTQPLPGLQLSVVQTLLSLQTTGVPGLQMPPLQVSPVVQALPSLQAAPYEAVFLPRNTSGLEGSEDRFAVAQEHFREIGCVQLRHPCVSADVGEEQRLEPS
jgi:hypothetical protein